MTWTTIRWISSPPPRLPALLPPAICYCLPLPPSSSLPGGLHSLTYDTRYSEYTHRVLPARCVEIWLLLLLLVARRSPPSSLLPLLLLLSVSQVCTPACPPVYSHPSIRPRHASALHRVLSVAACSACTLGRVRVICTGSRPSFPPSRVPAHSPYHHHPHRRRRRRHQATSTAHRIPHTSRSKYPLTSTRTFALLLPLLLPTH